jgi:hypothetical protein
MAAVMATREQSTKGGIKETAVAVMAMAQTTINFKQWQHRWQH